MDVVSIQKIPLKDDKERTRDWVEIDPGWMAFAADTHGLTAEERRRVLAVRRQINLEV